MKTRKEIKKEASEIIEYKSKNGNVKLYEHKDGSVHMWIHKAKKIVVRKKNFLEGSEWGKYHKIDIFTED